MRWFGDHTYTQVEPDKLKTLSEGLEAHHRARKKHRKLVSIILIFGLLSFNSLSQLVFIHLIMVYIKLLDLCSDYSIPDFFTRISKL